MLRVFLISLIVLPWLGGCGGPEEPIYEGLTLAGWVERLADPDPDIRIDALKVIASIGPPARKIEDTVRTVARRDDDPDVRMRAIEALNAMGMSTVEFQRFVDFYNAPIYPTEDEELSTLWSEDEEEDVFQDNSSDDDLEYLRKLESGELEKPSADTGVIPSDSAAFAKWVEQRQLNVAQELLQMLDNPVLLAEILRIGDQLQREFAARALAEKEGEDLKVVEALEQAREDPDETVRQAAAKALGKWKRP